MINNIAVKLSFSPNFINYTFKGEMCGDAIIKMFTALKNKKFDCDRGFSPFSYFTKIAFNSFRNRIKKEQKMRETLAAYKEDTYDALLQIGIDVNKENTQPNNDGNIE
jgi:DNA-directed RNA polymerase specialized sigma24 family protein